MRKKRKFAVDASNFLGFIIHDAKGDDFVLCADGGNDAIQRLYVPDPGNAQRFASFELADDFLKRFGRPGWEVVSLHDLGDCFAVYRDFRP